MAKHLVAQGVTFRHPKMEFAEMIILLGLVLLGSARLC
jgi:hypothetical protein